MTSSNLATAPEMPATTQPPQVTDFNLLRMFQEIDDQWDLANLDTMYEHVTELAQEGPPSFGDSSRADNPWTWDAGG